MRCCVWCNSCGAVVSGDPVLCSDAELWEEVAARLSQFVGTCWLQNTAKNKDRWVHLAQLLLLQSGFEDLVDVALAAQYLAEGDPEPARAVLKK